MVVNLTRIKDRKEWREEAYAWIFEQPSSPTPHLKFCFELVCKKGGVFLEAYSISKLLEFPEELYMLSYIFCYMFRSKEKSISSRWDFQQTSPNTSFWVNQVYQTCRNNDSENTRTRGI